MKHSDMLKSACGQERGLINSLRFLQSGVMRRITYTLLVSAVVLLGLLLMSCAREQPSGEQPDGQQPGGEQPGGEDPDGEDPDGEDPDGEEPGGGPVDELNFDSAIDIDINSFTRGAIDPAADSDYYRLDLSTDVNLVISTRVTRGVYGQLYDSARNEIPTGYNDARDRFEFSYRFSAGTYYLRIRHFLSDGTGNYELLVQLINQPAGAACDSVLPAGLPGNPQCVSVLHCYNDVCRASQPAGGRCNNFTQCDSGLHCYIPDNTCRASQPAGGTCNEETIVGDERAQCERGLHCYIPSRICRARQTGGGSCDSEAQCTNRLPCLSNLCQLPDLDAVATSIAIDSTFDAAINPHGDNDYYKIAIASDATIDIYTTGSTNIIGELYDSSGNDITTDGELTINFRISPFLSAGNYYIRVVSAQYGFGTLLSVSDVATGSYRLHIESP